MQDQHQRHIEYLRVSITDRCNLRCSYCMPAEGVPWLQPAEILTYEEILRLIRLSIQLGFSKFRITGGEPLVRKGVVDFVRKVADLNGVEDLTLTTNGIMLKELAMPLKAAGLRRVNISLDTLEPNKFAQITRGGELAKVLAGIDRSIEVGLEPVKLNVVVMRGFNDMELADFAVLAEKYPLHVRFIELMPIGTSSDSRKSLVTVDEMKQRLGVANLTPIQGLEGSGPARYVSAPGLKGSLGFINAISQHFCAECNRVRLTADGKLKPCLHSSVEHDLRQLLRSKASDAELQEALARAIWLKPSQHHMQSFSSSQTRVMSQIGG